MARTPRGLFVVGTLLLLLVSVVTALVIAGTFRPRKTDTLPTRPDLLKR